MKEKIEALHPTYRTMEVIYQNNTITVNFNKFTVNAKGCRIMIEIETKPKDNLSVSKTKETSVCFKELKPVRDEDKPYFQFLEKEYHLMSYQEGQKVKEAKREITKRRKIA